MTEKTFDACDATLNDAMAFVEQELEKVDCPLKIVMQITVCMEEMYVNVAHYAYGDKEGKVVVSLDYIDGVFSITLTDWGMEFDPLKKEDPDITLSAEERDIGGLGIYMVKNYMDEVRYDRIDGKNIFMMAKKIA